MSSSADAPPPPPPPTAALVIRETPLAASAEAKPAAAAAAAPPAHRGPPPILPFILAIALPIVYGLLAAPLFQSAADPDTNVPRLPVMVASFDTPSGGVDIGARFTDFWTANGGGAQLVTNNGALAVTLPGIQVVQASQYSAEDLRQQVKDSKIYAAVFVNAGASAALAGALASPAGAAAYDPSKAMTLVWDEARNNQVTTARIGGPLKGMLGAIGAKVAGLTLGGWLLAGANANAFSGTTNGVPDKALLAKVLAAPVSYSEESLYPFTVPALNQALTVGQILLCVFALIITNMTFGPVNFIPFIRSAAPGFQLALRRLAVILLLACMVGVAFATILVGIANKTNITMNAQNLAPGVTYGAAATAQGFFSGSQWAQIWATQWMETAIFTVYLCIFVTLAGNPAVAGALLGPMIIFNSLSISVDTSDAGFQFFWYAPMWHSAELVRNIMFGTLSSRVGMHVGVHWLWLIVEVALFFAAHQVVARREAAAAAARAAAAGGSASAAAAAGASAGASAEGKVVVEAAA